VPLCHSALLLPSLLSGLESPRHLHLLELTSALENQYDTLVIVVLALSVVTWCCL